VLAVAQLADQRQLLVLGAGDHLCLVRFGRFFSSNARSIKNGP
jgi:hypothetical protein